MAAQFDVRNWPLLSVHFAGHDDDAAIDAMLTGFEYQLKRGRCSVLIDTTETVFPGVQEAQAHTHKQGMWLRAQQALIEKHVVGVAFVIPNPAVRFVLSSIMLVGPLTVPHVVVSDLGSARLWCFERLSEHKLVPKISLPRAGEG